MKNYGEYSDLLVQRVNELYHDAVSEKYENSHPEIFKRLPPRWQRIAPQFLTTNKSLTILDLGTGTGFVPLMVAPHLKKKDKFICSDISSNILSVAKENIQQYHFQNKFGFVKIDAQQSYTLPFNNNSMDIVTVNSMLHHIKDTRRFLDEIDRVLKPRGLLFIAHEPHRPFHRHRFLKMQARIWQVFLCPRQTITRIARILNFTPVLECLYYTFLKPKVNNQEITEEINKTLLEQGLITEPIAPRDIKKITDIQVEGFKLESILPEYKLVLLETYNHLSDDIAKKYNNNFILAYERFLERKFPHHGNQFFLIKQKPKKTDPEKEKKCLK